MAGPGRPTALDLRDEAGLVDPDRFRHLARAKAHLPGAHLIVDVTEMTLSGPSG
jgi:hypothetical protein